MEPQEYHDGFTAYIMGKDPQDNPYNPADWCGAWTAWANGWMHGLRKEKQRAMDADEACSIESGAGNMPDSGDSTVVRMAVEEMEK